MKLIIAKIDEVLFDGDVYSLTAPGTAGEITVLGHHEPLITTLKAGNLSVHIGAGDDPKVFPIESGVLEVRSEGATVVL